MTEEEWLDVVDHEDRALRPEARRIVHRDGLRHRAVHVFVFNQAGQLCLQRRSMRKDSAPGKWVSSCSGHVDSGEDYDAAAARELGEEIGLHEPQGLQRIFKERACAATENEFVWVYTCQSEGPFNFAPEEVSEGRWIHLEALERWLVKSPSDFAPSFVYLWQQYKKAG